MQAHKQKRVRAVRRSRRVRERVFGTVERPRLSVFRSLNHIYAQIIDDVDGQTLCSASSRAKSLASQMKVGGNCAAAAQVGRVLAEQARMKNIRKVAFDRGSYRYHGRIKALAEAARQAGLDF